MQVRSRGIARGAADADDFAMREIGAADRPAGLHSQRAHVPIPGVISIRVPQADVNPQVAAVVLRVVPARIDNLVGIRGGQEWAVADPVIDPIVTVIEGICAQPVAPVPAIAVITQPVGRRGTGWRRVWTGLVQRLAQVSDNLVVGHVVVGAAMVENRFFGGAPVIRRVQERRHQLCRARRNAARETSARKQSRPSQGNHQHGKFRKQAQARVH